MLGSVQEFTPQAVPEQVRKFPLQEFVPHTPLVQLAKPLAARAQTCPGVPQLSGSLAVSMQEPFVRVKFDGHEVTSDCVASRYRIDAERPPGV